MSYTISWGTTQGGPYTSSQTIAGGSTRQAILNGLTAGTTYYFVVQANSFAGCSSANSAEGSATTTGSIPQDPAVTAWVARIIANGGVSPGAATLAAVNTFWGSCKTAGIDTLIKELNFFAPDSTIAALTPFIVTREANLWTGISALSNAGLDTNATTTLNTAGLGPNYFTTGNCGMSWYGQVVGSTPNGIQCGTGVGGNDSIFLYPTVGVSYAYPACFVLTGATPFAANNFGFLSLNRVATNDLRVFWGNNAIPVVQTGATQAAASGAVPAAPSWNVGNQAGQGGRFLYNSNIHCVHILFAVHLGFTLTQAKALQAATATLRIAFGGSA